MEKSKKLSLLSSSLFMLTLLLDILRKAIGSELTLSILNCLYWVFLLSMAIVLMTNKHNKGFLIISVIYVIRIIYGSYPALEHFSGYKASSKLYILCNILSAIALFVLFLTCLRETTNSKKILNGLWFIPGILLTIRLIASIKNIYPVRFVNQHSSVEKVYYILVISGEVTVLLAFLFTGLWLKTVIQEEKDSSPALLSGGTAKESIPALGGADKLLQYKELLDSGIITQEEFNEKKKQVLGL